MRVHAMPETNHLACRVQVPDMDFVLFDDPLPGRHHRGVEVDQRQDETIAFEQRLG